MNGLFMAALGAEACKMAVSVVVRSTAAFLIVGIAVLTGSMFAAAAAGNEQILAQLGDVVSDDAWLTLIGIATRITSAAALLAFGVVLAWTVGREFSDGTINGLFALPVRRSTIVAAKMIVFVAWTFVVAVGLVAVIAVIGVTLGNGRIDADAAAGLARLFGLTGLSGLLAVPAAWAATLGRSMLPGIATAVGTIAVAQVAVVAGSGAWFPVAAPALWARDAAMVSMPQLACVGLVPAVFGMLAIRSWSRLELDR